MVARAVAAGQLPADTDTRLATLALHTYIGGIMREWVLTLPRSISPAPRPR